MVRAMSPTTTPSHNRLDIQGLRAIAVLAVVADHAGLSGFTGGYVGVDVFFVVSGFLITGLLLRESERDGRISLTGFYARRARRILPAATLVLVAIVTYATLELSYRAVQRITTDAAWAAVFLSNVRFSRLGTDYFAEGLPPSPVQHYWSLAVEEQFYLVWPLLLILLLLVARRRLDVVAGVLGLLCAASLAWSVVLTGSDETAAYFSSLTRAWELGIGALLALAGARLTNLGRAPRLVLGWAGLAAIALAVWTFDAATPFPGFHALLPVLGTAALIAAGTGSATGGATGAGASAGRALSITPLPWIGDLSYSIYLWHWPVLVYGAAHAGTGVLLALTLLLSLASYHLVENPFRNGRWFRGSTRRGLVLWPAALAVVLVAVMGGRSVADHRLEEHLGELEQYEALRSEQVPVRDELAVSLELADSEAPVAFPLESIGQVDELARDLWNHQYKCFVGHDRSVAKICPVGDVDSDKTLVVLGDSHAGQWLPAFDRIGQEQGYRVVPLIKLGCVPYDVPLVTDDLSRPYTECEDFRSWVLEELPELDPDVVYVSGRGMPGNYLVTGDERSQVWRDGVASTVRALQATAPDVRLLADTNRTQFDPIDCLTDLEATMATCTAPANQPVRDANRATRQAAEETGATYVDITPLVCLEQRCPSFAGGRMVFANADHLSIDWVEHILPELEQLDGVLP
ncbi:acyltransferase family protein [Nocardioides caricicola]